ncbi:inositol monophosphatase [Candidatus Curtissbacteria bacterium]|nr:inositol monophosphatase [Candidatus Curtissbacteria bacterium]
MLDTAIEAARAATKVTLKYFKNQPKVQYKPDASPVTIADKTAEKVIRGIINQRFPDHGIIGEEFPAEKPEARFKWIIDPIDGTRDFIRGMKLWSTFIALSDNGKIVASVAYYPTTDEMFTAQKGRGTRLNGKKIHVSKIKDINYAYLSHGQITRFEASGYFKNFMNVARTVNSKRNFGSYSLAQLLNGHVDIYLEPGGGIWDFATPSLLVEEAGGKFTNFAGQKKLDSGNAIMTNGVLHTKVLKLFNQK